MGPRQPKSTLNDLADRLVKEAFAAGTPLGKTGAVRHSVEDLDSLGPLHSGGKRFLYTMPDGETLAVEALGWSGKAPAEFRNTVQLDIRDARGFRNYDWKGKLGPSGLRAIATDVAAAFPEATVAKGPRVSGARAGPAAKEGAKSGIGEIDLERVRRVADRIVGKNTPAFTSTGWDRSRAAQMARVYDALPDVDETARGGYQAMAKEVRDQFAQLEREGIKVEFTDTDPYAKAEDMVRDVTENRRLKVFKTAPDQAHPFLSPEENDLFRAVHDYFGHYKGGRSFGPWGEEQAYRAHSKMFVDPLARRAMATETRGQNSWFNAGPHGDKPAKERPFAKQKGALWPEEYLGDYGTMPALLAAPALRLAKGDPEKVIPSATTAGRSTPAEIADRLRSARAQIAAPLDPFVPNPRGFIDRALISPDAPVAQSGPAAFERVGAKTDRAALGQMQGMADPENLRMIEEQVRRGLKSGAAQTFYPSYGAVESALANAGGNPRTWLSATSAGSIRNSVPNELAVGSVLNWALKRGLFDPSNVLTEAGAKEASLRVREALKREFPDAQGFPLMSVHTQTFGKLLQGIAPGSDKVPTYLGQKGSVLNPEQGLRPGLVLDTHEAMGQTLGAPYHNYFAQKGGFERTEYGPQEDLVQQVIRSLGVSDRTGQAARWLGGGEITGLRTAPKDYGQLFDDLVARDVQQRGKTSSTFLRDLARGDQVLYPTY